MSGELEKHASDAEREQAIARFREGLGGRQAHLRGASPTAPRSTIGRVFGLIGELKVVRR